MVRKGYPLDIDLIVELVYNLPLCEGDMVLELYNFNKKTRIDVKTIIVEDKECLDFYNHKTNLSSTLLNATNETILNRLKTLLEIEGKDEVEVVFNDSDKFLVSFDDDAKTTHTLKEAIEIAKSAEMCSSIFVLSDKELKVFDESSNDEKGLMTRVSILNRSAIWENVKNL